MLRCHMSSEGSQALESLFNAHIRNPGIHVNTHKRREKKESRFRTQEKSPSSGLGVASKGK